MKTYKQKVIYLVHDIFSKKTVAFTNSGKAREFQDKAQGRSVEPVEWMQ
jgi:hypothetical protein